MEGFPSNLNDTFTSTRGCEEPMFFPQHILPCLPLYNAQWWGYESLTAIVLVFCVIEIFNKAMYFLLKKYKKNPIKHGSVMRIIQKDVTSNGYLSLTFCTYTKKKSLNTYHLTMLLDKFNVLLTYLN